MKPNKYLAQQMLYFSTRTEAWFGTQNRHTRNRKRYNLNPSIKVIQEFQVFGLQVGSVQVQHIAHTKLEPTLKEHL